MYILYATNKNGDGNVITVGKFESLEDIEIRIGFFADDVVIHIEEEKEENEH